MKSHTLDHPSGHRHASPTHTAGARRHRSVMWRRLRRWRRGTWLIVGTGIIWAALFLVWYAMPTTVPVNDRQAYLAATGRTDGFTAWLLGASLSIGMAGLIWMATLPPNRRPPDQ